MEKLLHAFYDKKHSAPSRSEELNAELRISHGDEVRQHDKLIHEFFSAAGFLKRLKLHMLHICKSKTKQQTSPTLYYC